MEDKILRFLRSIHIENTDDFDVSFEMLGKDVLKPQQLNMVILKNTPWEYHLLRQFMDGLQTITYPYMLRFSYLKRPDYLNVISLFDDWYQTLYHLPHDLCIKGDPYRDHIVVVYDSEEKKAKYTEIIKDFKDFLNFISYEFTVREVVEIPKQDEEEILIPVIQANDEEVINAEAEDYLNAIEEKKELEEKHEEESLESITTNETVVEIPVQEEIKVEAVTNDVEEEPSEDTDSSTALARQKEIQQMTEDVEDKLLEQMKQNAEKMRKERERARLNKRGNYKTIELIDSIDSNSGSVDFDGKVFSLEIKEFAGKKKIILGINDSTGGAIYANMYQNNSLPDVVIDKLVYGANVRVRGVAYLDEYTKALQVKGHFIDLLPPDEVAPEEGVGHRVELHLHSKMSAMDAVSTMDEYCKYAKALGHTAIALTDHAVVQAYPDAQKAAKKYGLKLLYGCELYVVDDDLHYIKNPANIPLTKAKYVVLDLETTGLSSKYDRIIEFGAVKVEHGIQTASLDLLINPERKLPEKIVEITHITDDMLDNKPTIEQSIQQIVDFIGDAIIVTHNADFDFSFLQETLKRLGKPLLTNPVIDTLSIAWYLYPENKKHSLGSLCRTMDISYDEDDAHRADYDAKVLNDVWQPIIVVLTKDNPNLTHADLGKLPVSDDIIKHKRATHATVLVKDLQGLKDLYKIVSYSHTRYLADVPRIPKSMLNEMREHLLVGSACFNGEVFRTAEYYGDETLRDVIKFYDYIEIQPKENYSYLINMRDISEKELDLFLNDIVRCADELNIPVVATSDCHYVTPDKKIFRDIYIDAPGLKNVPHPLNPYGRKKLDRFENPDQHFRTTQEMLNEMAFLGEDKAYEVVVTNTNAIADQIESILPVPNNHLYTPTIENCDQLLKDICYNKAHELYGDPLPQLIQDRLDVELNGIISNGFTVIYYIAHKLVKKANDDGYIVGSRGSVGSSFVATMSGITEVNALPPHYRCPHCKHVEWTKETMPEYKSGYDLPEKKCPTCGEPMVHDGQDIPFQTFLGFHAEKVPDIDLNFPGDYQARAHNYTKELFGEDFAYRAGTIETVAEKTAYGFVLGYFDRMFMSEGLTEAEAKIKTSQIPKAKIGYLAAGCVDVKRTTGQHPGGIVVVPHEHEVFDFTPYQYPADDNDSSWRTTHFDFHSIHDTILKLDLLGHVDPVALRMMCELTHIDIKDIPLNDKKVLSIFSKPDALGMDNDYTHAKTGALAIPEFGTRFVRQMLEETKPETFADLVIISGLSHGTGVWAGNADKLIEDGTCSLREVIGCRDDIMTYLIGMGIDPGVSFKIMEDVRKGKGLKLEYEEIMKNNNVPQYYINSCNLIQYMFPKGHAVAYVTMAIRVGYFKVYYPLEFYATFFSVRSKQHDIVTMIKGREAIIARMEELQEKEKLSPKEDEQLKTLYIALEMVQRGYKFSNIDLYKSDATRFVVDHENKSLIPPFNTIDGLGDNNAETVVEERKKGEFFSKEDLLRRTKLTSTNVKDLSELGVLDNLNETDQLSLFDF